MVKIAQGKEKINFKGGNILIGTQISNIGLEKMDHLTTSKTKHGEISHSNIVKMAVVLLANGHSDFFDIDLYRNDTLFQLNVTYTQTSNFSSKQGVLFTIYCSKSPFTIDRSVVERLNHLPKILC